jgi:hypothetical protein
MERCDSRSDFSTTKEHTMIPAQTDVTCPCCDTEFTIKRDLEDDDTVHCDNCDTKLILIDGDLEEYEEHEDIEVEDEDEEEEENPQVPIAQEQQKKE